MPFNSSYYTLKRAAQTVGVTVDDLINRGAVGDIPIYTEVLEYHYFQAIETVKESPTAESKWHCLSPQQLIKSGEAYPLQGLVQVSDGCLHEYETDPEHTKLTVVKFLDAENDLKDRLKWRIYCSNDAPRLSDIVMIVMAEDLERAGFSSVNSLESMSEFADDPRWRDTELDIAVQAWRHAAMTISLDQRPKKYMAKWIKEKYPKLTGTAVQRIATTANWYKDPGSPENEDD